VLKFQGYFFDLDYCFDETLTILPKLEKRTLTVRVKAKTEVVDFSRR
jgi:hypothetical protein